MSERPEALDREKGFHDQWASEIEVEDIDVRRYFEGATSPENRFILNRLGDLRGKRMLDLGCGAGENSVYATIKGARCIGTDLSPRMLQKTLDLAAKYDVEVEGRIGDAMSIDFPDNTFDIVYASNLLHHVDPERTLKEMHRVLNPGGKACFWDPLRHNPLINVYRHIANEVRTSDERPLDINIVRFVRQIFSEVYYDTFWLASLWIFLRFYLIESVDPNMERYWKKIIYEEERLRETYHRLERMDRLLKKLPFMKRFAWNIAVVARK